MKETKCSNLTGSILISFSPGLEEEQLFRVSGFTKIPLLAKISSISVSAPENCKKRLWLPLRHKRHLQYHVKIKTFFFCWNFLKSISLLYRSRS